MAILPLSHSETKSQPHLHLQDSPWLGKRDMAGRNLGAAPAAGARMNKCKIVNMVVSVLAVLLLMAAVVSLARYVGKESFLKVCVATHLTTICTLAWFAARAPTPASRRSYARATVTSFAHLALNLFLVLLAGRAEVEDTA